MGDGMTDDQFRGLCNVYGFAPSRSLRELLEQAVQGEREECAALVERIKAPAYGSVFAEAIRARAAR